MNKTNETILIAYNKGYRVLNGIPYNPNGIVLNGSVNKSGYLTITPMHHKKIKVHRLVGYQKYGYKIFEKGIVVRHLDGNKLNNTDENIAIGTQRENMLDIPKYKRVSKSIKGRNAALKKITLFTPQEMEEIRNFHNGSYKETMKKFNIISKGTLHRILNKKYVIEGTEKNA